MTGPYYTTNSSKLGSIDFNALPTEYQNRVHDFDCRIAQHEMRGAMINKARRWTNISLAFDIGCITIGGFCFYETCRVANEQASYLFSVTGNPFLRRACTPFPFVSSMFILLGICFLPPDLVSHYSAKHQLAIEENAIQRLSDAQLELVEEGLARKAAPRKVNVN